MGGKIMFSFKVNFLFLIVLLLFILAGLTEKIIVGFILVTLHEIIHFLTAKKLGYHINKIEIFPFGGMAEYKGLLEMQPYHEIVIALSGPVFNFILAGLFLMLKYFLAIELELLIKYNLVIGVFNLLPALPLDGGRILRGILVTRFGFKKGSYFAAGFARFLAITGFIINIIALFRGTANIWIFLLSFFVYGAALKEKRQIIYNLLTYLTDRKRYIETIRLKKVMVQVVAGKIYLKEIIYYLIPDKFNIFYVLDDNSQIAGMVSEAKLLESLFNIKNRDKKIIEIVDRE